MTAAIRDEAREHADGNHSLAPFLAGAALGGAAGVLLGTLLSAYTAQAVAALIHFTGRRSVERDRERLKFELMLQ
jgi:hypothetical protein